MAAQNNSIPQNHYFPSPQFPATETQPESLHQQPTSHGYYYATPHQLYPYMSLFYSNIQTHPIKTEHDPPIHPTLTQIWSDRNKNKNISPQQLMANISPANDSTQSTHSISQTDSCDFENSGYWNLPPITYGPLASKSNLCEPKQPRIGDKYQAHIPSILNTNDKQKQIFEDECVWECNKVNPVALDEYLRIVQFVLGTSKLSVYTDCHYDEETALYLLKLHNYDVNDTINTLTLHKPDKNNVNFQWLFNKTEKNKKDTDTKEMDNEMSDGDCDDNNAHNSWQYGNGRMMSMMNICGSQQENEQDMEDSLDDEDYCFSCGDGGTLLVCDKNKCLKVWHIHCAGLTKMPVEDEWYCPSHICCVCKNESIKKYQCSYCGNAYCNVHCPDECMKYNYHKIEFLCQMCLSQMNDINDTNDTYKFASERFMLRLLELHKRKRNHLNKILGKKKQKTTSKNIIPSHCKLGRNEIEWFDLYCAVISCGGLSKIKDLSSWDVVRKKCELNKNFKSENIWKTLRDSYIEYLYCYEKQYFYETSEILPRGIQSIVDNKGALDGLFPIEDNNNNNNNKTPENVDNNMHMEIDVD